MTQRKILYLPPTTLSQDILSPKAIETLEKLGDVSWNELDRNYSEDELLELIPGTEVVVTSWGSPPITAEHVAAAPELKVVAHAAGSVKKRLDPDAHKGGILLLSASDVIAEPVAEYTIWAMLSGQRSLFRYHQLMKVERGWKTPDQYYGHLLAGQTVGIVSASMVGRRVINLLKPFNCDVVVYDPYLSDEATQELGVRTVSLEALFAESDIISIHAPSTPETKNMITGAHFQSIRDDALLINTARTWVLDQDALLTELQRDRFYAIIDVFEPEPLPADHPIRDLDNVYLTPHVSGHSIETRMKLVQEVVYEVERYYNNEPLRMAVSYERLQIMA